MSLTTVKPGPKKRAATVPSSYASDGVSPINNGRQVTVVVQLLSAGVKQ
jgi:hypothetical protein